ncbi:MAG: hypothetical protein ACTS73_01260 [Arsenophonus sp. NEOnobi-MAG3]
MLNAALSTGVHAVVYNGYCHSKLYKLSGIDDLEIKITNIKGIAAVTEYASTACYRLK